jgi:hypothetical protein
MTFGHVGSVATIMSYERADSYFNSKPAHTRCKGWQPHERCLKERASGNRHYRIEQHNGGEYYDVCLYQQVMARFYRPNAEGHSRVLYSGHVSVTSKSFMYRVLGVWHVMSRNSTGDACVITPIYNRNSLTDINDSFSLDMMLDANRQIIIDKSRHTPHYTHKSNAEDKAKRVRIKEKFANYIMLAQMRMPEFADNCNASQSTGRPFGGSRSTPNIRMAVESIWEGGDDIEQHWVNYFFEMCQDAYDTIVAKRGYDQANFTLNTYWSGTNSSHPSALDKPVTEKDLEKAILNRVYKLVGANTKSEAVLQPQFMVKDSYPSSSITTYP